MNPFTMGKETNERMGRRSSSVKAKEKYDAVINNPNRNDCSGKLTLNIFTAPYPLRSQRQDDSQALGQERTFCRRERTSTHMDGS